MKTLYIISAALTALSIALSLYMFTAPLTYDFIPHWVGPLMAAISLLILYSAKWGPKPENPERGFWAILLLMPLLGILVQLYYLAQSFAWLSIFGNVLVPILGYHVFLAVIGNYVTTSKSLLSGIPTPWNLRSDLSWAKSHRFMGFAFVATAFISAGAILVTGEYQHLILAVGLFGMLPIFAIYSWWVWKEDPNRRPLMGKG